MQSQRGGDQVPRGQRANYGGSEAKEQLKGNQEKILGREQEVQEEKDVSSDEGLPIYPDFEYEVNYEKETYAT